MKENITIQKETTSKPTFLPISLRIPSNTLKETKFGFKIEENKSGRINFLATNYYGESDCKLIK